MTDLGEALRSGLRDALRKVCEEIVWDIQMHNEELLNVYYYEEPDKIHADVFPAAGTPYVDPKVWEGIEPGTSLCPVHKYEDADWHGPYFPPPIEELKPPFIPELNMEKYKKVAVDCIFERLRRVIGIFKVGIK